jgi:ribosomal protein S18 acetylase RimI-like enzyme
MNTQPASGAIYQATGPQHVDAAANTIAVAFSQLQATAWLVPDPNRRMKILTAVFAITVEHALEYGHVDMLDREGFPGAATGAAVWFAHEGPPIPEPRDYDARLQHAAGEYVDRFHRLDDLFEAHHPGMEHDYLALLAAQPTGRGIGTSLLEHHHAHLDRAGLPAYLEAASSQSRALYQRHGYEACGEPFELPNGATFYPMQRPPAGDQ